MSHLSRQTARILYWGLAAKTRDGYGTAPRSYIQECALLGVSRPFQASLLSLSEWIGALSDRPILSTIIKSYLSGVRSAQLDMWSTMEEIEVFSHPTLQRLIAGIKLLRGEAGTKERRPITRPLLFQIVGQFDQKTLEGATLHAAFTLAFAAFLRIREFTWTAADFRDPNFYHWHFTRNSVVLLKDRLKLVLPASKTDPFRQGVTIIVAAIDGPTCAVKSVRHLMEKLRFPGNSTLFRLQNSTFTRQFVTNALPTSLA